MAKIGATIDPLSIPIAAARLGIRQASMSGVVRAALALYHGKNQDDAVKYAVPENSLFSENSRPSSISAQVPDELTENCGDNLSYAVRVGLGIAMGMTRNQAEHWATMPTGQAVKRGRPRKQAVTDAG